MSNGYNPMKWDCGTRGCFNAIRRPKIEVFAEVLPGRIAMSDIDAGEYPGTPRRKHRHDLGQEDEAADAAAE